MESERVNGATTEVIQQWFRRLAISAVQEILPSNRWNMDESGIMEGYGLNGLVVGSREKKEAIVKSSQDRNWTTIIECISATGQAIDPLVIFKGKDVQQQWFPDEEDRLLVFKGWAFDTSQNGWTSNAIGLEWLQKVFIPKT
jgi:hypothetical protein